MSEYGADYDAFKEPRFISHAIDLYLGTDYRISVVEQALNWRKKASREAQKTLKSNINSSNFSVQGFRSTRAYNAPTGRLLHQIIEHMPTSNGLSSAILSVWVESHESLRADVLDYRKNADLPFQEFISDHQFSGSWDFDEWDLATDGFVERNDRYLAEDVALMLCCVSGNMPLPPPDDPDDEDVLPEGSLLPQWIKYLKQLPPDAPEWQEAEDFIVEFNEIRQAKELEAEQALTAALAEAIAYIRDNFLDELRYLEVDIDAWSATDTSKLADIAKTQQTVEQLGALLFEYCQVRIQAPTRSEEDARRSKRSELEPQILSLIEQIDRQMSGDQGPDDDAAPPEDETAGHANTDGPGKDSDAATARPNVAPETPSDGADSANPSAAAGERDPVQSALQPDYAALKDKHEKVEAERQEFEQQVKKLQLDTQSLKESEDGLRRKLYESKENYRALQSAYVAVRRAESGPIQSPGANGEEIPDIKTAVEVAGHSFEDRLLFALNSKSEKNPSFEDTTSVWKAFEWLATEYYDSRCNGFDGVDGFDEASREACGLWYKPKQSDTAKGKYPDHYTTKVNGTTYWLDEHIGRGSGDPRTMIRIAFAWDKDRKVVVVGYIGRHQRTDAT